MTILQNIPSLRQELERFNSGLNLPDEVVEVIVQSIRLGQKSPVKGLGLGEKAPDFILPDENGNPYQLSRLLKHGPVVLSFFRGDWCPYCNLELQALQQALPEIKAQGARLISVHPQTLMHSEALTAKYGLDYPLLSDPDQMIMEAYNVRFALHDEVVELYRDTFGINLVSLNANGQWNLPIPATFVIGTDGLVKARHFDHDYRKRMEPSEIVDLLKQINVSAA
ncbi:MAG TPA: alkyl hydroperoxide reductase [Cytophagales bacterium]|nr:alkyl hydroperoxide reductase [Cytophagales bacterium]HAA22880.1 alkyl hydroperoxide reductase [Cytophagales bacterium]HAP60545.1 alkyl hydroperoxide reductase [Cytophagales bacterium]